MEALVVVVTNATSNGTKPSTTQDRNVEGNGKTQNTEACIATMSTAATVLYGFPP